MGSITGALALDFDGVLCDSVREVYLIARRTFRALMPHSPLARDASAWSSDPATRPETFLRFCDLLPLGNRAEDFGVALRAVELAAPVTDQETYDGLHSDQDPAWLQEFHRQFYRERAALISADPEAWVALHAPYPRFLEALHRLSARLRPAILTARDGDSVRLLLERFGVGHLFPPELVMDKEVGVQKTAHLSVLAERLGVEFPDITFVDDKLNHLLKAAPLGVRPVLAGWGHNTPREHEQAPRHGIAVAGLEDVERLILEGQRTARAPHA